MNDKYKSVQAIREKTEKLQELFARKVTLLGQLAEAQAIKVIWPEAFDDNKTVTLVPEFTFRYALSNLREVPTSMKIVRSDGEVRPLSYDEYILIKNPSWRESVMQAQKNKWR